MIQKKVTLAGGLLFPFIGCVSMVVTIQDVKDFIKDEFEPIPVIRQSYINRSVTDAIRKYNRYKGMKKEVEADYSEAIDLSSMPGRVKDLITVIPNAIEFIDSLGTRSAEKIFFDTFGTDFNLIDAQNEITNWVQRRDLWENVRSFLGTEPEWTHEGDTILLANFPSGVQTVLIKMRVRIPNDDTFEITDDHAEDWIMEYSRAKLQEREGFILDKSKAIDMDVGGGKLEDKGEKKASELVDELKESRNYLIR